MSRFSMASVVERDLRFGAALQFTVGYFQKAGKHFYTKQECRQLETGPVWMHSSGECCGSAFRIEILTGIGIPSEKTQ
jgi:hypothetical protein